MPLSMTPALTGFGTGLGLIVAIGAQNAWVLRQGVRREHIGLVIAICALSDLVLICVGTGAIGLVTGLAPWLLEILRLGRSGVPGSFCPVLIPFCAAS